jgi:elongation factor 1 alpha-like protein
MGRLLHAKGALTQKQQHRNERDSAAAGKASFSWAWALDERPEERERGVTVDVVGLFGLKLQLLFECCS